LKYILVLWLVVNTLNASQFIIFEGTFLSDGLVSSKSQVKRFLVEFKRDNFKCRAWIDMTSATSPSMVQAIYPVKLKHSSCLDRGAKLGYLFENIVMLQSIGELNEVVARRNSEGLYVRAKTKFEMLMYSYNNVNSAIK
jgi:hypothetical protein